MTFSVLGTDTQTNQRVELPKTSRLQGLYIIGIQGTGKSGLIENLIMQDIKQQIGVCVLDPHGELIDHVIARLPGKAEEDKVILLDLANYSYPFGLNLFTCADLANPIEVQKTVDQVMHVFEKLLGVSHDTPLILQYLRNCTYTLVANSSYTMAEIPLLLTDKNCRQKLVANVKKLETLTFWRDYDAMPPSEQRTERSSTLRRVEEFLQDLTKPIVGQSTTTINLQKIMHEGKILLVKLSAQVESVSSLIGSLMIALLLRAAYNRPAQRRQFHLYADEFQRFATEDFATLLEEARKFGIATTIAHQNRSQLDAENKQLETNLKDRSRSVGNMVVFKINSKDADDLAGEFNIVPPAAETRQEAVVTYEHKIIGFLLTHEHGNPAVEAFKKKYLLPIDRASKIPPDPYRDRSSSGLISLRMTYPDPSVPDGTRNYPYEHKELQEALTYINEVLYDEMAGKDIFLGEMVPGHDFELVNSDCYYDMIGLLEWFLGYRHYWFMQMGLDEKSRKLGLLYLQRHHDVVSYGKKINWDADAHFRVLCQREDEIKKQMSQNLMSDVVHLNLDLLAVEEKRCKDFMASLKAAAKGLLADPIRTAESGRYEEKPLAPRTYADVQNEIANSIVGLPNFTARIKIGTTNGTVEHTIKTLEPEQGLYGKLLQERVARIQARNRDPRYGGYCRSRKEVETEITQRQTQCIGNAAPAQPQIPQATQRYARQVSVQGKCSKCGFSHNPPGANFCMQCGTKL